jgi:hypothetical protein
MRTNLKKIKNMNYRKTVIIVSILLITSLMKGQPFTETRIFHKTFAAGKETTLEINNKYGTIHMDNWNKDSVSVRVEIEATSSSESKLGKMLSGIRIDFSESSYLIIAQTEFTQSISMLFESFKKITSNIIPYDTRVQINYFVSVPENINLNLENKYGDIYMENNSSEIRISLSNGSFKANSLNKASKLSLTFCDAKINKIVSGNIEASFSEAVIGESANLNISSVSGRFELKQSGKIHCDSRRDKFMFGKLESIDGDGYFTEFRIDELKNDLTLLTKYGSLNINSVDKSIQNINVNSSYSDMNFNFDPAASYNLDIRHINAFLKIPEGNSKLEKKTISDDKNEYMTFGTVGKNPGNVRVKIDANRGNIYIK